MCKFGRHTVKFGAKAKPRPIRKAIAPGQVVSVDSLLSLKASLLCPHIKEHQCLLIIFTSKSTVEACEVFEAKAADMGVTIKNYHCDNGRFIDHGFHNHCKNRINIDYC